MLCPACCQRTRADCRLTTVTTFDDTDSILTQIANMRAKSLYLAVFCFIFFLLTTLDNCLAQQANIDEKDETGMTALMQAAQDGTANEIKAVLKKGPNIEIKDSYGWTALMYAAAAPDMA